MNTPTETPIFDQVAIDHGMTSYADALGVAEIATTPEPAPVTWWDRITKLLHQ